MTTPLPKVLLRVPEASEVLGLSRAHVYRLIQAGEIEAVHIGTAIRLPVASIDAFIERLREAEVSGVR